MEYYVYITNDCNMNCSYCSVLFDTKKHSVPLKPEYDFNELKSFIISTQRNLAENIADIYFFGGEPTTNCDCIEKLIDCMSDVNEFEVNYILHTNGLLVPKMNPEIIQKLKLVIISINYEKVYSNEILNPYIQQIFDSVDAIKSIGNIPIIGRITVSSYTSIYSECCLFGTFFDYVYWQLDNCRHMDNYDKYNSQYKFEINLLYKYWLNFFINGVFLNYVPFTSVIKNMFYNTKAPKQFFCGYGTSMIYVQTNGRCYACCDNVETNSHYIGDIFSGINFPPKNIESTICADCEFINVCGGRCGRMHKDFSGERISQYCDLNKYMFALISNSMPVIKDVIKNNPTFEKKLNDNMIAYTEYTS